MVYDFFSFIYMSAAKVTKLPGGILFQFIIDAILSFPLLFYSTQMKRFIGFAAIQTVLWMIALFSLLFFQQLLLLCFWLLSRATLHNRLMFYCL